MKMIWHHDKLVQLISAIVATNKYALDENFRDLRHPE